MWSNNDASNHNNFNVNIDEQYAQDTVETLRAIEAMISKEDNFNNINEDDENLQSVFDYIDTHLGKVYEDVDEEKLYQHMYNIVDDLAIYFNDKEMFIEDRKLIENILYE